MCWWPHLAHADTWPPSAAVPNRGIEGGAAMASCLTRPEKFKSI
jgi:hypothetical protein